MNNADSRLAQTRIVFAILVKVFGIIFLIATVCTVVSLISVNDLLANAAHVDGQVIKIVSDSKERIAPVVRFKTSSGQILDLQSNFYTSPGPSKGDKVRVVYRNSNPRDWQIDDWIHLYFGTLMGAIFMFAWGIATMVTRLVGRHQVRKLEQTTAN